MRKKSIQYYNLPNAVFPSKISIHFPDVQISVLHNGRPIVHDFQNFLQSQERKDVNHDYLLDRLHIQPYAIPHIDRYTLRSVMQRNQQHRNIYSKIIHLQPNTMSINHRWGTSITPNCPICHKDPETWQHVLKCSHSIMNQARSLVIADMATKLEQLHTYPRLLSFILDFFKNIRNYIYKGSKAEISMDSISGLGAS